MVKVPNVVPVSVRVSVPVGVVFTPDTVTVKVTVSPKIDGFSEEARATVAAVRVIVWVSVAEVAAV
jgi:hypothetical protein